MTPQALEQMRKSALEELAKTPVARPWWKDALVLAGINALIAAACTIAMNRGFSVGSPLSSGVLLAVMAPLLMTVVLGAIAAVIPRHRGLLVGALVVATATGGLVVLAGVPDASQGELVPRGMPCLTAELIMAIVPTGIAVLILSRFAYSPLRMFVGGLAAGAAGLFALHLHCPVASPLHLGLFHVAPWISAAALSVLIRGRVRSGSYAP